MRIASLPVCYENFLTLLSQGEVGWGCMWSLKLNLSENLHQVGNYFPTIWGGEVWTICFWHELGNLPLPCRCFLMWAVRWLKPCHLQTHVFITLRNAAAMDHKPSHEYSYTKVYKAARSYFLEVDLSYINYSPCICRRIWRRVCRQIFRYECQFLSTS